MMRQKDIIGKRFACTLLLAVILVALSAPHKHGKPILVYGCGAVGFLAFGMVCLWLLWRKHPDLAVVSPVWVGSMILGCPFLSWCYVLCFMSAWRGVPEPASAFLFFLFGMGLWGISVIGMGISLRRAGRPHHHATNNENVAGK